MNAFSRSEFLFLTVMLGFFYGLLSQIVPARLFIIGINSAFFGVSLSVIVTLSPLINRALRTHTFDRVSQLSIGIAITWLSLMVIKATGIISHSVNYPDSLFNSRPVSFATYLAVIGGVLYITAPGMVDDRLKYNRKSLAFSLVIGIVLAITLCYYQTT